MGCTSAKPVGVESSDANEENQGPIPVDAKASSKAASVKALPFVQTTNAKCPHIRLDHPKEPKKIAIEGKNYTYTAKYVYVSQRGYYPNAMGKANQDSYLVSESLLGNSSCNVYGIFDGHGEFGDYCSFYCADNFTKNLTDAMDAAGGINSLNGNKMEDIYTKAFVKTNTTMNKSDIDDSLSGTTGVTILQHGDRLLVGNVGDSRAIIATSVDGKLKYSPLSNDQTPYRKDERERLKKLVRVERQFVVNSLIVVALGC